ncbi:MAG: LysR family transcriptional regulator [Thiothrix sp.]|nr:LysR family transcriptional regulator [Thiothrix sp.]HPQ93971.1 LysR family transcriptional regulator [Thiolinea sp.]
MNPKHLLQLAVILEKGSISAAAEHLLLTQPTLTRNMHTLEMQVGGRLFSRSRFGVRSTPLGETLARDGRAIARQMQAARESASRYKLGFHNQLQLGVGPLIGMALMPRLCERLAREHPEIALTVVCDRPQHLMEQMIDGDYDIVLAPAIHSQIPSDFGRCLLAEDRLGVFCGPTHPLAGIRQLEPQALDHCEWMVIGSTSPFENMEQELLAYNNIRRVRTQFATMSDAVILLSVLMQGRHLAVLPKTPLTLLQATYPLAELPLKRHIAIRNLYFWYRESLWESEAIQTCLNIAQDIVTEAGLARAEEPARP